MNSNEDFRHFSLEQLQRVQALVHRMQAVNSLLNFFKNDIICDRYLANDCQPIIDWLKTDFENGMEALSQIFEVED